MWRSLSGTPIGHLSAAVSSLLRHDDQVVHVGTDSQHFRTQTTFVTVVAVIDPTGGGRIFYERLRVPHAHSLADKLFREAQLSIEAAQMIERDVAHDIVVHVDANEDGRHRSSRYVRALAGMVVGYGFGVRVKPDSWCASHVADYLVKGKHRRVA